MVFSECFLNARRCMHVPCEQLSVPPSESWSPVWGTAALCPWPVGSPAAQHNKLRLKKDMSVKIICQLIIIIIMKCTLWSAVHIIFYGYNLGGSSTYLLLNNHILTERMCSMNSAVMWVPPVRRGLFPVRQWPVPRWEGSACKRSPRSASESAPEERWMSVRHQHQRSFPFANHPCWVYENFGVLLHENKHFFIFNHFPRDHLI